VAAICLLSEKSEKALKPTAKREMIQLAARPDRPEKLGGLVSLATVVKIRKGEKTQSISESQHLA
jgi:hypothetical protein